MTSTSSSNIRQAPPWPEDLANTPEFKCRVIKTKWGFSDYGSYKGVTAAVIEGPYQGNVIWFRAPKNFVNVADEGVEFSVSFQQLTASDNLDFGFGRYPTVTLQEPEGQYCKINDSINCAEDHPEHSECWAGWV